MPGAGKIESRGKCGRNWTGWRVNRLRRVAESRNQSKRWKGNRLDFSGWAWSYWSNVVKMAGYRSNGDAKTVRSRESGGVRTVKSGRGGGYGDA